MKNLILTLLLAVFSVAFVTASPPKWDVPKYEKFADVKTDISVGIQEVISVSPVDQSYASIRTEAGTRIQNEKTITPIEAVEYNRFKTYLHKRWQLITHYDKKPQLANNSKFLRSTIYNTASFWPQLE